MKLRCRFLWHPWSKWEDIGIAIYHGTGHFQKVQESHCTECSMTRRRWAGWASLVEINAEHAAARKIQ